MVKHGMLPAVKSDVRLGALHRLYPCARLQECALYLQERLGIHSCRQAADFAALLSSVVVT